MYTGKGEIRRNMEKYIIVKTAIDDLEIARKITYTLLEQKLVSCVQEKEVLSHYWWKGKIEYASEYILEMNTRKELYSKVEQEILKLHPYEVPEIIAIDINQGLPSYFKWIEEETNTQI